VPPLRERRGEIAGLLKYYVSEAAAKFGRAIPTLDASALQVARAHGWPGNIRELVNRVDRADDLFPEQGGLQPDAASADDSLDRARETAERAHIAAALRRTDRAVQEAATILDISRTSLWKR